MAALPTTGITTSMVASAIGAGSNDVGTLCTHPNINKWSKYKPVSYNSVVGLTEADFKIANYGFTVSAVDGSSTINSTVLSRSWLYSKPTGGALSPYRLGDFRGYDHNEQPPMLINEGDLNKVWNVYMSSTPSLSVALSYKIGGTSFFGAINNRLNVEDFKISNSGTWDFDNLYFALGAFEGTTFHCVTAPAPLSDGTANGGASVSSISGSTLADYLSSISADTPVTIYPFLNTRNDKNTVTGQYYIGNVIPLPNFQPITFTKDTDFWLIMNQNSMNINHPNFGAYISQRAYQDQSYTNLASIKTAVINSLSTSVAEYKFTVRLYGNTTFGKRDIDLKDIMVKSNLFDSEYYSLSKMHIIGKVVNSSFVTIGETIFYNSSPTVDTSYNFTDASNTNYYVVEFYVSNPITVFRDNAINDANLPSLARYNIDFQIFYKWSMVGLGLINKMEYRFS